jgi:hypothetical protein
MRVELLLLSLIFVVALNVSGCLSRQPIATQKSPDGMMEVNVAEVKAIPDSTIEITLKTGTGDLQVLEDPTERVVREARVLWSTDSKIFIVRVFSGGEDLIFAYDTRARHQIQLPLLLAELKDQQDLLELIRMPEDLGGPPPLR